MTNPQDRLLDALFPTKRGSRYERALARSGHGLISLADRRCGIGIDSDEMPTGVWAHVGAFGGWLTELQHRAMTRRWAKGSAS